VFVNAIAVIMFQHNSHVLLRLRQIAVLTTKQKATTNASNWAIAALYPSAPRIADIWVKNLTKVGISIRGFKQNRLVVDHRIWASCQYPDQN
jgi:hypothetical protein